jgi:hypothetical protein
MSRESPVGSGIQTILIIIAAVFFIIFTAIICLFLYFWFVPPKYLVDADEGFKKAKATIDPEPLRAWALDELKRRHQTNDFDFPTIPDVEIPKYIKNLYAYPPEQAFVEGDTIDIMWGGGFFHWTFRIGNTNCSEPFLSQNSEYPYNFEWTNGIYYTREANRKLQ